MNCPLILPYFLSNYPGLLAQFSIIHARCNNHHLPFVSAICFPSCGFAFLALPSSTDHMVSPVAPMVYQINFPQYFSSCPIKPQMKQNVGIASYLKLTQHQSLSFFLSFILRLTRTSSFIDTPTCKNSLHTPIKLLANEYFIINLPI